MQPKQVLRHCELAGAFVARDPHWRNKIFFGGLLLLIFHPLGWPIVLGYRKELIARLFSGEEPVLPEWRGNLRHYFVEGVKAMGVIFGYLAPLYALLLILLLVNGVTPDLTWLYVFLFFFVFMIVSTLSFPITLIYWTLFAESYRIPPLLALMLLIIFTAIIFFIPAGFLQVSKSGRYLSAFNLKAGFSTLRSNFRRYLLAWYHSILMSVCGHFALPLAPWGVVWCYLGIIFEFNSILAEQPSLNPKYSWYERFMEKDALFVKPTGIPHVLVCSNFVDIDNQRCYLVKLGPILIPLPGVVTRLLKVEAE